MSIDLYAHQRDLEALIRDSLRRGYKRVMAQAATGFGKTILAAVIIRQALAKDKRVIFCVPAVSLVDQTVEKFAALDIRAVGVLQGQHPQTDGSQPVQVCTIQTLEKRATPDADLVLIDEAHIRRQSVVDWMSDPAWKDVPFIGLSATPWAKGLGKVWQDLVCGITMRKLIEKGFLSPFKVFAPSHPDLSKVRVTNTAMGRDYSEADLAEVMNQPALVGDVVSTWLRLGEDRPTLCFAVDRAHAKRLAEQFEAAGVPVGYVDKDTERDERNRIGARLASGQIKVVCNIGCLTTGVDWDVRCIVLARPTKSEMLFVQIIGRGLRTAEGKTDCIVLDHSDTTSRLGFPTDIHYGALDSGSHTPAQAKARERQVALPKECPKCTVLKPAGVHACPHCGFKPERQSPIEEHEGELIAVSGRGRHAPPTMDEKQRFFGMLVHERQRLQKSEKWVAAKYKDRFEVWPRGMIEVAVRPDLAFLNWMRSRNIAYARKMEKERRRERLNEQAGLLNGLR